MEYDPKQFEILFKKVASTLGSRLYYMTENQKMILENQLNDRMIYHGGNAESVTPDEIEGAYEIATVYAVVPRQFFGVDN